MSAQKQYLNPLSNEILKSYQALVSSLSKLPSNYANLKKIEGTGGTISVRNILAYQIGWGKLLIGWYKCGLLGKSPEMPGEGFSSWNYVEIALHFYQKYHLKGLQEQLQELGKIVETIVEIIEKEHKRGYLDKPNVWSWCTLKSGKHWPLRKWIRVNTVAPYKKATSAVRRLLREL